MANFGDLVGAFMQSTMTSSGGSRIGSAIEQLQRSGLGDVGSGAAASGGPGGLLGDLFDAVKGGLGSAAQSPGQAGGLGAVVGSLLGGGKGAVQGGMLAMLASVAMKALSSAGETAQASGSQVGSSQSGGFGGFPGALGDALRGNKGPWSGCDAPIGMRVPQNTAEQEALEFTAQLVLKGMINAAKSDGQISPDEMQRIVGKLQESGADQGMQQWVLQQMREPLNVQAFAAEIPNQEVAAEVYAASLLAVEVDTDAERRYLRQLAEASRLHPLVVGQIHQTLGVKA
ncbi:MAG: tellurite resistance TerB family protein [Thiohalocapsa sp.]